MAEKAPKTAEPKAAVPKAAAPKPERPAKQQRPREERSPVVEDIKSEWNGPLPGFLSVSAG
jgi:hypothetical protein